MTAIRQWAHRHALLVVVLIGLVCAAYVLSGPGLSLAIHLHHLCGAAWSARDWIVPRTFTTVESSARRIW